LDEDGYRLSWEALQIKDIEEIGRDKMLCPYKAMQYRLKRADVIFCPYNYIIDAEKRKTLGINLKDKIILIDEAHNIASAAESSLDIQITSTQISSVLDAVLTLLAKIRHRSSSDEESLKIGTTSDNA
jgi:Fanconi anemia group J protein